MQLPSTPKFGIYFAMVMSLVLVILKGIIGFLSGSLAIIGSALDSFMDMFVSGVNAVALRLSERPGSKRFAYGLGKVQGFAAIFEGIVVGASGIFLGWNGYKNFVGHVVPRVELIEILTMIVAIMGTGIIMWNFLRIARVTESLIIRADALHYSSDLIMNGGILAALLGLKFFGWWWADAIFAIGIAIWIIKNAIPIIWSGVSMLLDRALAEEDIAMIESLFRERKELKSFHYLKTRQSGDDIFIEAHLVFRDEAISLRRAHTVAEELESELGARFLGAHITLHLDLDEEPELCDIRR